MVTVVVLINLLISLLCLYAARKVWRIGKKLSKVADTLTLAERRTYAVLSGAPKAITRTQGGTSQLRQRYRQLELQLQKAQEVLALTGLSQVAWQWYTRRKGAQHIQRFLDHPPMGQPPITQRSPLHQSRSRA